MKSTKILAATLLILSCSTGTSPNNDDESGGKGGAGEGGQGGNSAKGGAGGRGGSGAKASGGAAGNSALGGSAAGATGSGGMQASTGMAGMNVAGTNQASETCDTPDFTAVIRDFNSKHPDFHVVEIGGGASIRDVVAETLDADGKPSYSWGGPFESEGRTVITGEASFKQWFRNSPPDWVMSELYKLPVAAGAGGSLRIGAESLFPIDGKLLGNKDLFDDAHPEDLDHNHLYTLELIAEFEYEGKGQLIVASDDDSWVFVNNKLAIDNAGVHGLDVGNVNLMARAEEFGLQMGQRYKIHFFMADRGLTGAGFVVTALNLKFTNCKPIMPKM